MSCNCSSLEKKVDEIQQKLLDLEGRLLKLEASTEFIHQFRNSNNMTDLWFLLMDQKKEQGDYINKPIDVPCIINKEGISIKRTITKEDILLVINHNQYVDISRFTYCRVEELINSFKGKDIPPWTLLDDTIKKDLLEKVENMSRSIDAIKLTYCLNNWAIEYIVEKKYTNKYYYITNKVELKIKRRKLKI